MVSVRYAGAAFPSWLCGSGVVRVDDSSLNSGQGDLAKRIASRYVVDIGRGHVANCFVVPLDILASDEVAKRRLQLPWEVEVLELHDVIHCPVIALDLAPRLRVIQSSAGRGHLPLAQMFTEIARQIGRIVVA